jgi:hypothetical protein
MDDLDKILKDVTGMFNTVILVHYIILLLLVSLYALVVAIAFSVTAQVRKPVLQFSAL